MWLGERGAGGGEEQLSADVRDKRRHGRSQTAPGCGRRWHHHPMLNASVRAAAPGLHHVIEVHHEHPLHRAHPVPPRDWSVSLQHLQAADEVPVEDGQHGAVREWLHPKVLACGIARRVAVRACRRAPPGTIPSAPSSSPPSTRASNRLLGDARHTYSAVATCLMAE
jgi:hypothetical protein